MHAGAASASELVADAAQRFNIDVLKATAPHGHAVVGVQGSTSQVGRIRVRNCRICESAMGTLGI